MNKRGWCFLKKFFLTVFFLFRLFAQEELTPEAILARVDGNVFSETRYSEVRMVVHGERIRRELSLLIYAEGNKKSYSEFLSPKREKGTKMLKLDNRLWIYSPQTDRTIQLSGHLLRQSIMGSDLSYEDMMEDRRLLDVYDAEVTGSEEVVIIQKGKPMPRSAWVLTLTAKVEDVSYAHRKLWIDKEYYHPLQEELYAKSKVLLKKLSFGEITREGGRWVSKRAVFKDMLKRGEGSELIIDKIDFNPVIPAHIFSKAILRR